ncbi:MAG: GH36-type glycosyl hydrolase domain-containing protein [Promethearchaeota archaeon]
MGNENLGWKFINKGGQFSLKSPHKTSYLYFPLVNESGMMSSITPELHGDAKTSQNSFLLAPVSVEDLHNSKNSRNFWCFIENKEGKIWSVTGNSAAQKALSFTEKDIEEVELQAGFLWHKVIRKNTQLGIQAEITNFVPSESSTVELMEVKITNIGVEKVIISPTAAIPLFCRSADNIRDHRHVTSLLHRIETLKDGIKVQPTFSFDERGHQKNEVTYVIYGSDNDEKPPIGYFPIIEDFISEGGSLDWPKVVVCNSQDYVTSDQYLEGFEAIGALKFKTITLPKGESASFRLALSINEDNNITKDLQYLAKQNFRESFEATQTYWKEKLSRLSFKTGNEDYNQWLKWVTIQPILRRIFGCSFLPHHDYGRGGRGWRDLWQDCLALLFMEPKKVRNLLFNNFAGVRFDGSNATIIGTEPGEFKADRNDIPRVWMDHGVWPFLTTKLYIDQTGDLDFLLAKQVYFKDKHAKRCKIHDTRWSSEQSTKLLTKPGSSYKGTILEHILLQHLTAFFHVGEHNNILLEGADWNDGLDMAREKGESVAFTALYGSNLIELAKLLRILKKQRGINEVKLAKEITMLLDTVNVPINYSSWKTKRDLLDSFFETCIHNISGKKINLSIETLASDLEKKGNWIIEHIRKNEWITNSGGNNWFNGYYDNSGKRLEGDHPKGVRITLTGQVFPVMGGVATDNQVIEIIKSINHYLWDERVGGVRLNTNFHEILQNMGRCFGFAYGHKENGAMFSHMAVMYANALYSRGQAEEGFKVLDTIFRHCSDFQRSKIYPGIPEYINQRGRGMYHYLTGSASWYLLTTLTRMFGVRGLLGDLLLDPMLISSQFDQDGLASVITLFANKKVQIVYLNKEKKTVGQYMIKRITINGQEISFVKYNHGALIQRKLLEELNRETTHQLLVELF